MQKSFAPPRKVDLLIFDMDGVLVDVSGSYRETIARTIRIYLEECFRIKLKPVANTDLSLFKSAGGFNNDWDLTAGFIHYLLSISNLPPLARKRRFSTIQETITSLRKKTFPFGSVAVPPCQRRHLKDFLERVKSMGGGIKGIRRTLGNLWEGWIYGEGDLNQDNLIKRIFQELYLGEKFHPFYHLPRLFYKGKGLYLQERLLIPRKTLTGLRKKLRLGIASGRPRFEAELALKRFHLLPYFDSLITLDECEEEERRILAKTGKKVKRVKPHPYPILRAIGETGLTDPSCGYVGDVVDDMKAARTAGKSVQMIAIGFLSNSAGEKSQKAALRQAGADLIIEDPTEFFHLIHPP